MLAPRLNFLVSVCSNASSCSGLYLPRSLSNIRRSIDVLSTYFVSPCPRKIQPFDSESNTAFASPQLATFLTVIAQAVRLHPSLRCIVGAVPSFARWPICRPYARMYVQVIDQVMKR
jgi:hypothetical protein